MHLSINANCKDFCPFYILFCAKYLKNNKLTNRDDRKLIS